MNWLAYPNSVSIISVLNLGRCDYGTALRLQERLVELRKEERIGNTLLFVEHPPTITLGRNAKESNIIASPEVLKARGVETFEINRGGDVTFHGPGQLVAYPIFDLRSFVPKIGVIEFVRRLEEVLMRTCAQWSMETQRIAGMTGVWTLPEVPPRLSGRPMGRDYTPEGNVPAGSAEKISERKVAAIGVHISRGVSSHGFALNVTTDMSYFQLIVPCGLTKPVTSMEYETGARPTLDEVMTVAARSFGEIFQSQMLWLESVDDLLLPTPQDTPARAPEDERRVAADDTHLA
ncbi:MAG: lipoyl(octanoyl) transferase LipB [Acidobacteriota bacterium]|nr:lipoyl(octanoyl) transferase LipB [Acidobacteriota bacterium]